MPTASPRPPSVAGVRAIRHPAYLPLITLSLIYLASATDLPLSGVDYLLRGRFGGIGFFLVYRL